MILLEFFLAEAQRSQRSQRGRRVIRGIRSEELRITSWKKQIFTLLISHFSFLIFAPLFLRVLCASAISARIQRGELNDI